MARRPTLTDLARAAGLSLATVDRVLNGRQTVRPETARRVHDAARRVGYHAAGLIAQRLTPDPPEVRFGIVLSKERQAFYQDFAAEIAAAVRAAPQVQGRAVVVFSTSQAPGDFAAAMLALRGKADVIAASAVAHPEVSDAVTHLQAEGVPVFALLNDFAQGIRQGYVGLNNLKVGRIAGALLGMAARPGRIAVFVGGSRWHGHELRETGLRSWCREHAPGFAFLDTRVNLETRQLTYEATLDLLARHPDLTALYCAGGGMEGAIAALREARAAGEVALVVNELTPESRAGLLDRYVTAVIRTPLPDLCRDLVGLMAGAVQQGATGLPGQHFLRPEILLPESLD